MKSILLVLVLGVAFSVATSDLINKFADFQHQYKKTYTAEEFHYRFNVFKANLERYDADNKKSGSPIFGVTKFSDLTPEEFRKAYLMPKSVYEDFRIPADKVAPKLPVNPNIPSKFDWNGKGVLTPVYNQQQCGSCWAFSATETIESYCALGGKGLQSLAMQQVVDCDTTAYGCEGGWTYAAYEYVQTEGGIEYFKDYPYTAESESCSFNKADIFRNITGWGYVTEGGAEAEDDMANYLVSKGPLSVCVDASSWSGYEAGSVITASACGDSVDHCVQITGLDVQQGMPVWNVRNSWGTDWGNQGYLWVQKGENACDITSAVTYVTC
jgi:C1A family cysteine protease